MAAATVLTSGGIVYALMDTRGVDRAAGGPTTTLPTSTTTTDPLSPGNLSSLGPGEAASRTPSKDENHGAVPGTTPPTASDKPSGPPAASPKPAPGSTVKEPTPVSTACTGWAHSNRSDGYGKTSQGTHLYTGPYAECSYVTEVKSGTKIYYHCYVTNAHANKWIYARIAGTNTEGWVFGDKSTLDGGTLARC
ncbi:hypothetical protein [Streptomyces sp. WAC06614]|uniref:hypothetical protein n=1 Tax=Streptomyces sp. WAC06614 TaxID=2487416 RepID=UPI00163CC54C|nr:hypothetical protein [Streptomyces sp. WAC06614]